MRLNPPERLSARRSAAPAPAPAQLPVKPPRKLLLVWIRGHYSSRADVTAVKPQEGAEKNPTFTRRNVSFPSDAASSCVGSKDPAGCFLAAVVVVWHRSVLNTAKQRERLFTLLRFKWELAAK